MNVIILKTELDIDLPFVSGHGSISVILISIVLIINKIQNYVHTRGKKLSTNVTVKPQVSIVK